MNNSDTNTSSLRSQSQPRSGRPSIGANRPSLGGSRPSLGASSIAEIRFTILREENERLKEDLQRFKGLEEQILQLETENTEKANALKAAELKEEKFLDKIEQLEKKAKVAESKHQELEKALEAAVQKSEELQQELGTKDAALTSLESDLQVLFHQKEDQTSDLMKTLDSYKERYAEAVLARETHEKRLGDLLAIKMRLRAGQEKQHKLAQSLHEAAALLQERSQTLMNSQRKFEDLTAKLAQTEHKKEAANTTIKALEIKVTALECDLEKSRTTPIVQPSPTGVCGHHLVGTQSADFQAREEVREVVEDLVWAVREIQYRSELKLQVQDKNLEILGYVDEMNNLKEAIAIKTLEMEQLEEYSSKEMEAYEEDLKTLQAKLSQNQGKQGEQCNKENVTPSDPKDTLEETLSYCQELQQTISALNEKLARAQQDTENLEQWKTEAGVLSDKYNSEHERREITKVENEKLQAEKQGLEAEVEHQKRLNDQNAKDYTEQIELLQQQINNVNQEKGMLAQRLEVAVSKSYTQIGQGKENTTQLGSLKAALALERARCIKLTKDDQLMKRYLLQRGYTNSMGVSPSQL